MGYHSRGILFIIVKCQFKIYVNLELTYVVLEFQNDICRFGDMLQISQLGTKSLHLVPKKDTKLCYIYVFSHCYTIQFFRFYLMNVKAEIWQYSKMKGQKRSLNNLITPWVKKRYLPICIDVELKKIGRAFSDCYALWRPILSVLIIVFSIKKPLIKYVLNIHLSAKMPKALCFVGNMKRR